MPVASLLAAIDAEIDTLEEARQLLSSIEKADHQVATPARRVLRRRKLSTKAPKAIVDAQRKRWAAAKGAVNTTPTEAKIKPSAPAKKHATRKMSAEAKKRIAMAQRKRWAAVRAQKKSAQAAPGGQPTKKISPRKAVLTKKAGKTPAVKAAKTAPSKKSRVGEDRADHDFGSIVLVAVRSTRSPDRKVAGALLFTPQERSVRRSLSRRAHSCADRSEKLYKREIGSCEIA